MEKESIPLHNQDTTHSHEHGHNHGEKLMILLFFVGLAAFLAGFILEGVSSFYSSMAFILSVITAGYHIILEGVGDTIRNSHNAKKFQPNVHFLMALAAAGAIVIGKYEEAAIADRDFCGSAFPRGLRRWKKQTRNYELIESKSDRSQNCLS